MLNMANHTLHKSFMTVFQFKEIHVYSEKHSALVGAAKVAVHGSTLRLTSLQDKGKPFHCQPDRCEIASLSVLSSTTDILVHLIRYFHDLLCCCTCRKENPGENLACAFSLLSLVCNCNPRCRSPRQDTQEWGEDRCWGWWADCDKWLCLPGTKHRRV